MPRPKLTMSLVGCEEDQGAVQLADFRAFCDSLTKCLRRLEAKFPDGATRRLRYRIVDLGTGSACMTVEPIAPKHGYDFGPEVIEFFSQTVDNIQSGKGVDPRLTNEDLGDLRSLAAPINRKVKEIHIGNTKVTSRFIANIDELTGTTIPSEGSVKGRLERLNVHNRFEFVIYPPIAGHSVRCVFTDDLFDQIHNAMRKNVTVHGSLHFRPGKPFAEWVQVKSIEEHPPDEELPTLGELRGSWKGSTGEKNAVNFIQAGRDD